MTVRDLNNYIFEWYLDTYTCIVPSGCLPVSGLPYIYEHTGHCAYIKKNRNKRYINIYAHKKNSLVTNPLFFYRSLMIQCIYAYFLREEGNLTFIVPSTVAHNEMQLL